MDFRRIGEQLGEEAEPLLRHRLGPEAKLGLHFPGVDFGERAWAPTARSTAALVALQRVFDAGRLAGTGHACFLDAAGAGAAGVELAVEGGCSAVVVGEAELAALARRYAPRLPVFVRVAGGGAASFRELVRQGVAGVVLAAGEPAAEAGIARAVAHAEGLAVLAEGGAPGALAADYAVAEAGVALAPLAPAAAMAAVRAQVRAAFGGSTGLLARLPLAPGEPLAGAVRAAVVNKRGGGMGLFVTLPAAPGDADAAVAWLHAVQDVYRCGEVTLA